MTGVRLRHRLEYGLYRIFTVPMEVGPESLMDRLGAALGTAARLLGVRRGTVRENLARAFPGESEGWRREVERRFYRHVGREAAALVRLARTGPERIRDLTEVVGLEAMREDVAEAGGGIIFAGHLGNWEIGGAAVAARGLELEAIYRHQKNPLLNCHLRDSRARLGLRVIDRRDAPDRIPGALARGRCLAIVADQHAGRGGVVVDFFGHPAATARGPALLSLRHRVPLYFGSARRIEGPGARYLVTLRRIEARSTGRLRDDVRILVQAAMRALEEEIRKSPEQYFWFHRRWRAHVEAPGSAEESAESRFASTVQAAPRTPADDRSGSAGEEPGGPGTGALEGR